MSAPKEATDSNGVMTLLRQAWRHAEQADKPLDRDSSQVWSKDLLGGVSNESSGALEEIKGSYRGGCKVVAILKVLSSTRHTSAGNLLIAFTSRPTPVDGYLRQRFG